MKKIGVLVLLLVFLTSAVMVFAGGKQEEKVETEAEPGVFNPADYPLAVLMPLRGHPVLRIVQLGFLERAKELGYPAEVIGTDGTDLSELIVAGESGVGKGIKGMMVWWSESSIWPFINWADERGVETVVAHFPFAKEDVPGLSANLCCDPSKVGREVAKAIGDKLAGKKGEAGISHGGFCRIENMTAEAFTDYMNEHYPNITVLEPVIEGYDPPVAIQKVSSYIQSNPDIISGFSTTGAGPQTWSGAMDATDRPDIIAVGMDYTEQNVDLVKTGKIFAIVAQPLYEEARVTVDLLDKMFRGEPYDYFTPLDAPVVTKEGIDEYADIIRRVREWFN